MDISEATTLFTGMNPPKATSGMTVIIPVRGVERRQALETNVFYLRHQGVAPLEILIVEEDTQPSLEVPHTRHVFLQSDKPFNKSRCINAGMANAKYDKVCMNDADMILQDGFLHEVDNILNLYDAGNIVREIFYLTEVPTPGNINFTFWRQWTKAAHWGCHGGNNFYKKRAFINAGGMCEAFVGHGSEDSEFYQRVGKLTNFYDQRSMTLLHMPHPTHPETAAANVKLWQQIEAQPMNVRLNNLKRDLTKWGLK